MDLNRDYSDVDPIIEKSLVLQPLCEQIIAGRHFAKGQQSIIDRCTENVYRYYLLLRAEARLWKLRKARSGMSAADPTGNGTAEHVGIVERYENGMVYTIVGNSGDACKEKFYTVKSQWIMGVWDI